MRAWKQKVILHAALLCLSGCVPSITPKLPTIAPTYTPTLQNTSTPTSKYHAYWKEFRESGDGWGIAVPINWITQSQYNREDDFTNLQILDYDLSFFESISGKEAWQSWGYDKSAKLEIIKESGFGKYDSLELGIRDWVTNSEYYELIEIEQIVINQETSVRYIEKWKADGQLYLHYAFQINLNEILIWSCYPNSSWERVDIQGILSSIALSRDANVVFPDVEPGKLLTYNP
jgi:hypothetical protein